MFQVVGGSLSVSVIFTIDLMFLKPYFHGTTSLIGAPSCFGSSFPYIPVASIVSGCKASSSRNPSTYGKSMPAENDESIIFLSYRVSKATYFAELSGSTASSNFLSGKPTHGITIDHASTQRKR